MDEPAGAIRVAPNVLTDIVRYTALALPGVVALDRQAPTGERRLLSRQDPSRGLKLEVRENAIYVELYVVAASGINLLELGRQLQTEVARALETMVGLPVYQVDVYFQDIQ